MEMCAWMTGIVQNLLKMYTCPVCTVHGEERLQKKALPDFFISVCPNNLKGMV